MFYVSARVLIAILNLFCRTPKCCILTRSGGCRKEASKYKFQSLISKFELYNVEPPVLKEGYDIETSRVCREHHRVSPRKYQEEEVCFILHSMIVWFVVCRPNIAHFAGWDGISSHVLYVFTLSC